jgi:hypothetical protein
VNWVAIGAAALVGGAFVRKLRNDRDEERVEGKLRRLEAKGGGGGDDELAELEALAELEELAELEAHAAEPAPPPSAYAARLALLRRRAGR